MKMTIVKHSFRAAFVAFACAIILGTASCTHNHKIEKVTEIDEAFENISISTNKEANISFEPSLNGEAKVVVTTHKKVNCSVRVDGATLVVEIEDTRNWFGRLGEIHSPKVVVYIPAGEYKSLNIKTTTGNTNVPSDFSFDSISIEGTTGNITCNASAKGDININNTTGEIYLNDVTASTLNVKVSTGEINLKNVVTSGKMTLEATMGNIKFDGCDAAEIYAKATTGSITGSLLSSKIFLTDTATGKVSVPHTTTGGVCDLSTTTGKINITIE